jgi:flagellin
LDLEFGQLFLEMQRIATQTTWNTMTLMDGDTAAGAVPAVALNSSQVTIQVGRNENQTMTLNFRSWDPRAAVKATTIMQTVNPVTGAAIAPAAALVAGAAGTVTTASRPGYDALGNDNHGIKTAANLSAQDTETQAYGAAVLFVGNGAIGAGVDDARINILSEANAGFALTNLDKAITAVATERARYGSYINRLEHTFDSHTHVAQHHAQSQSVVADAEYAHETSALAKQAILQQAGTAILAQANTMKEHTLNLLS